MKITSSEYVKSFVDIQSFDLPELPMVAFVGRSNVGKSTLMNHLLNRKKLVKTSSTPGKTQMINVFLINESFYLIDLPGYGFAKAPKGVKESWKDMILAFLFQAPKLKLIMQLIDVRHEPSKDDKEFHSMLLDSGLPYLVVANKADKISTNQQHKQAAGIKKVLNCKEKPILHSSIGKIGKDELLAKISAVL